MFFVLDLAQELDIKGFPTIKLLVMTFFVVTLIITVKY